MCARVTRGVPSCILNIDRVEANMEGVWSFSIDREVRQRNISQSLDLELVMVELPNSVHMNYEDQQVMCAIPYKPILRSSYQMINVLVPDKRE